MNREQKFFTGYYLVGMLGWFGLFKLVFGQVIFSQPYCFAHGFCLFVLLANAIIQITQSYTRNSYRTEERIYEYVERNTYYLILAITVFLLISATDKASLLGSSTINFQLIVYSQASAIGLCIFVIALYWMPTKKGKEHWLAHLRHFKTIIFTYALSLFFLGPVEVFLNVRKAFLK